MNKQKKITIICLAFVFMSLSKEAKAINEPVSDTSLGLNEIEYKAEGLKDPFQPFEKEAEVTPQPSEVADEVNKEIPLPSLAVQGVVWGSSLPQVIINNKVLKIGDIIEGARISSINKEGVILFYGNQQYSLSSPAAASNSDIKEKSQGGN
jgi:type II secretory pathway component PulC